MPDVNAAARREIAITPGAIAAAKTICDRVFLNPFRTAVPFWGQITQKLTGLSPKRDCGSEGVKREVVSPLAKILYRTAQSGNIGTVQVLLLA